MRREEKERGRREGEGERRERDDGKEGGVKVCRYYLDLLLSITLICISQGCDWVRHGAISYRDQQCGHHREVAATQSDLTIKVPL